MPEKDRRRNRLPLDLHRACVILDAMILAARDGFKLPDAIERQHTAPFEEARERSRDRPRFEHGAAPPHHASGRPDVRTDIVKILFAVLRDFEDSLRMRFAEPPHIVLRHREFQRRIAKDVHEAWIRERPHGEIGCYRRILAARERQHDLFL